MGEPRGIPSGETYVAQSAEVRSRVVSASKSQYRAGRKERNEREADRLEAQGYRVTRNLHNNGAFAAVIGDHKDHEISVVHILAENGLSASLDKEGNLTIKDRRGQTYTLPSSDGRVENFSMEIAALTGTPSAEKVADAIAHSFKAFNPQKGHDLQSSVAITITPLGAGDSFNRTHIDDGVKEFRRRVREGETSAKPLAYLHIDEKRRKVWYREVKT